MIPSVWLLLAVAVIGLTLAALDIRDAIRQRAARQRLSPKTSQRSAASPSG